MDTGKDERKCFLCKSTDISHSCPNGKLLKESVSSILNAFDVSPASVFDVVHVGDVLKNKRLLLCNDCDNLISKGIQLKKQLGRVRSKILSVIPILGEDEVNTSACNRLPDIFEDVDIFRHSVLGIVSKCFGSAAVNVNAKNPIVISEVRSLHEGSVPKTPPASTSLDANIKCEVEEEVGDKTKDGTSEKMVSSSLINPDSLVDDGKNPIVKIEAEESIVQYGDPHGDPFLNLNSVECRWDHNKQNCHSALAKKFSASVRKNDESLQKGIVTSCSSNSNDYQHKGMGANILRKRKYQSKDSRNTCESGSLNKGRIVTMTEPNNGSTSEFLEQSYSRFSACYNLPCIDDLKTADSSKDPLDSEASYETLSRHSSDETISPGGGQILELYKDESDVDLMLFDTSADENASARLNINSFQWTIKDVETAVPKIKCSRKQRLIPRAEWTIKDLETAPPETLCLSEERLVPGVEVDTVAQEKKHDGKRKWPQQDRGKAKLIKERIKKVKKVSVKEPERPASPSAYVFYCKDCPAAFHRSEHLEAHTALHPKFECEQCGKILHSSGARSQHVRMSHLDEPAACIICGKIMKNRFSLRFHKLMHTRKRKKVESTELIEQPYSPDVTENNDDQEEG